MDLQLAGRTALVTGASSVGLGRAIALGLAREGARLAITSRREALLKEAAREIGVEGCIEPVVIAADLYEPDAPERLAASARERVSGESTSW